jgi:hypothetical protein
MLGDVRQQKPPSCMPWRCRGMGTRSLFLMLSSAVVHPASTTVWWSSNPQRHPSVFLHAQSTTTCLAHWWTQLPPAAGSPPPVHILFTSSHPMSFACWAEEHSTARAAAPVGCSACEPFHAFHALGARWRLCQSKQRSVPAPYRRRVQTLRCLLTPRNLSSGFRRPPARILPVRSLSRAQGIPQLLCTASIEGTEQPAGSWSAFAQLR